MQWLRLQTSLYRNDRFVSVSHTAQAFYVCCMMLAGQEDWKDGRLAGPLGPYKPKEFAGQFRGFDVDQATKSVKELLGVGLFERDSKDGAYIIARFFEKGSIENSSTERVRAHRERQRNVSCNVSETETERPTVRNGTERDVTMLTTFASEGASDAKGQEASEGEASRSARRARVAKEPPPLPDSVSVDYERLVANDARSRSDGKIADSVVAENEITLRRAYEKRGDAALLYGISRALDKGAGVRFAAGCVRNFDPSRDAPLRVPRFERRDSERAGPYDRPLRVVQPSELT